MVGSAGSDALDRVKTSGEMGKMGEVGEIGYGVMLDAAGEQHCCSGGVRTRGSTARFIGAAPTLLCHGPPAMRPPAVSAQSVTQP